VSERFHFAGLHEPGEAIGFCGETLIVAFPSVWQVIELRAFRAGERVWSARVAAFEQIVLGAGRVLLVRPYDDEPRVRALRPDDGMEDWIWNSPAQLFSWIGTPFALLLLLREEHPHELAVLTSAGTLSALPRPIGPGETSLDLVTADPARVVCLGSSRHFTCVPLAEPAASGWQLPLSERMARSYALSGGALNRGYPPPMFATDAGLVVAERGWFRVYSAGGAET
jgi:hypothetical protein